jgi:ligand-binding sensor domain-containing protein
MRHIFVLLSLLLPAALFAQEKLLFENYTSLRGPSQNTCFAISQDGNGFMWFGTQDGLNRYDGREFKVYSRQNVIGQNLPGNIISSLFFDEYKNLLWVGTIQGACIYHPLRDSLLKVSDLFPFASQLEHVPVKKIISFRPDEYWIVTFNSGLLCVNTKDGTVASFFTGEDSKTNVTSIALHDGKIYVSLLYTMYILLPSGSSYSVKPFHEDYHFPQIRELFSYNQALWIGTMAAGCYYIHDPVEKKENIIASNMVLGGIGAFTTDNNHNLWIGTRGNGIYRYDPKTRITSGAVHNQYNPTSPCSNYSLSIFKDRQGIIWCGFYGGITKYDPLRFQFSNIDENSSFNGSLTDKTIVKMYKCRNGISFIGTLNKGIMEWNRANNQFIHYPGTEEVNTAPNVIYDITEDDRGRVWAASCGGLMQVERDTKKITYYPEKKLPELNKLYALIKLKKADSLLVASENGLRFFSLKDKKWSKLPESMKVTTFMGGLYVYTGRHIYEDEDNVLWICTEGSGLLRYDYLHNRFTAVDPVNKISLFIRHLLPVGPLFWLSTDDGLILYDWRKNEIVKHLTVYANGSNVCYAVQKDDNGFYWVSTNSGLCKINARYEIVQRYNTGNGLSFSEYNTACVLKDNDGSLHFGGMGGITNFNPSVLKQNDFSPMPLITAISVNNKPWPVQGNPDLVNVLDLDHTQNFLTIQFAVNNFSNEVNNLFSYRLKGLNDGWSVSGTGNIASFTSLPPGNYSFELRSANSDGRWSDGIKTMAIVIHPAWWQTWLFRLSAAILIIGLTIFFIRRRIRNIRREAAFKQQLAEIEIKGLHAQMNPHFIFNCLNSIKEMIWNEEKQNASRYLSKFAQLIRTSLEQSRQTFITVRQCIDHLQQYLEMEKLRFEDFSYCIDVDENLNTDEAHIVPMLVQPLVENAIWHGLRSKEKDRELSIRFFKEANRVICEIEDNGVGIRHAMSSKQRILTAHRSMGIINIQERLALLNEKYNMECSLKITDRSELPGEKDNGTLAVLQLTNQLTN